MIYPNDLKTTLFSEIAEILEEADNSAQYDIVDAMIELMNEDQLNQLADIITNMYPKD
tara:strand:- start:262 stop:435 length:174 start_codon:yes stop_codon:yes gene_type:complete